MRPAGSEPAGSDTWPTRLRWSPLGGCSDVAVAGRRATALMVDGKMAAFVTNEGELVVKLPAAAIARLTDAGTGAPLVMNGRSMREWFSVPRSPEVDWFALADEAVTFVRGLEASKAQEPAP